MLKYEQDKEKKKELNRIKKKKKRMYNALRKLKPREKNEEKDKAIFYRENSTIIDSRQTQYACLKEDCLLTFSVWGEARGHMMAGCWPTRIGKKGKNDVQFIVKPNIGESREKARNESEMST